MVQSGSGSGAVVVAGTQTAGRGRSGRVWQSYDGGLFMSMCVDMAGIMQIAPLITLACSVAVRRAILSVVGGALTSHNQSISDAVTAGNCATLSVCKTQPLAPCNYPQIKWPNDLLINGKKGCGILTELVGTYAVVGVGVNVCGDAPPSLSDIATTLESEYSIRLSKRLLCKSIAENLDGIYADMLCGNIDFIEEYRAHCQTIGQNVSISQADGSLLSGIVVGISDFGRLVLGCDGTTIEVMSGEVVAFNKSSAPPSMH